MKIIISFTDSSLVYISYPVDDRLKYYTLSLQGIDNPDDFLIAWLISKSRHIFEAMPSDDFSLALNKNLYERFKDPLNAYWTLSIILTNIYVI